MQIHGRVYLVGPSLKDVSPSFIFWGYPPPNLLVNVSFFGIFCTYPPPFPLGETSLMDGPVVFTAQSNTYNNQIILDRPSLRDLE